MGGADSARAVFGSGAHSSQVLVVGITMQGPAQPCLLPHLLQFLCALNHGENAKPAPRGGSEIPRHNGSWSHLQCDSTSITCLFLKPLPGVVLVGAQLLLGSQGRTPETPPFPTAGVQAQGSV